MVSFLTDFSCCVCCHTTLGHCMFRVTLKARGRFWPQYSCIQEGITGGGSMIKLEKDFHSFALLEFDVCCFVGFFLDGGVIIYLNVHA